MAKKTDGLSPMMTQYMEIKEQNKDSIIFFRLGDFYEMFFDDARLASEELDLTLTGRDCGLKERAPMCGVPYHSCEGYIARLVEKGYKVAVCEQTENPATAKDIVKREVVRIITPGTIIEGDMLDESKNNYLASVYFGDSAAVCFIDASTGESHLTEISGDTKDEKIIDEIVRFSPSEIILSEKTLERTVFADFLKEKFEGTVTKRQNGIFDKGYTYSIVCDAFKVVSPENLGIAVDSASQIALGTVLDYLFENGKRREIALKKVNIYTPAQFMRLDMTAVRNLELKKTMRTGSKKGSLLGVLDKTKTAMGRRLISSWVTQPLTSINEINFRQNAIEELCSDTLMRCEAIEFMTGIRDVERIVTKTIYGTALPKEMLTIATTARRFPLVKEAIKSSNCKMLKGIYGQIDTLEDIADLIESAISDEATNILKEGKIIKKGYNAEVDMLREAMNSGTSLLSVIETRERERTGIKTLRVRYNKVFGYYIEVTNSFKDMVPEDYIRKQTLVGAERYITEELKELETKVLTAKDKVVILEREIYDATMKKVAEAASRFRATAEAIARLDALCSLSEVAVNNNYTRPLVNNSGVINITGGRHPVIEQIIKTPFVTNDTYLDTADNRCAIITGPNMAGKSTYMRQTALITIMAQIGSFVPAEMAQIGIVDAVYTRVGASDDLSSGQSTFMVEMSEVADILKNATKNSLIILDEIGRGTATYDGMSIARAVLEYVADRKKLGAKSLFATHYHELTAMENEFKGVKNYNISAKKRGDDIIFLRRIVPGGADESYGIEVASLSGIPKTVIERAKEILRKTLDEGVVTYKTVTDTSAQLPLEVQGATDLLKELKNLDVNTLTPIEAMGVLFDLSKKAKET